MRTMLRPWRTILNLWLEAVAFLTPIPLRIAETSNVERLQQSAVCFPMVGLVMGCCLALVDMLCLRVFPVSLASLIVVVAGFLCSGSLHLDGWVDTWDGLASGRERHRQLEIMRDSRIGTMGALALVVLVLVKWTVLESLVGQSRIWALITMPAVGRASVLWLGYRLRYASGAHGIGELFAGGVSRRTVLLGWLTVWLVTSVGWGWWSCGLVICSLVWCEGLCRWYRHSVGGITGDLFGAGIEGLEMWWLLLVSWMVSW